MHLAGFEESVLWEIDDKEFRYIAIRAKKNVNLISSMRSQYANIEKVTHFVLNIDCNFTA